MQNTPDRHPRKIIRATIPAGFPCRIRHNKQVTATRPLQRNFAAAFRITPNAGCVPGTGAARMLSGAGQGAWDGTGCSAMEATLKLREEPREQCKTSRNSRKNNGRNSGGARWEQRRKQQQGERKKANYSEKSGAALTIRKQHSQKILIIRPLSNSNQIHKS